MNIWEPTTTQAGVTTTTNNYDAEVAFEANNMLSLSFLLCLRAMAMAIFLITAATLVGSLDFEAMNLHAGCIYAIVALVSYSKSKSTDQTYIQAVQSCLSKQSANPSRIFTCASSESRKEIVA